MIKFHQRDDISTKFPIRAKNKDGQDWLQKPEGPSTGFTATQLVQPHWLDIFGILDDYPYNCHQPDNALQNEMTWKYII